MKGMWTQTHREIYRQSGVGLPSDLTDGQWSRLEPLIPAAKPGGLPRETNMRAACSKPPTAAAVIWPARDRIRSQFSLRMTTVQTGLDNFSRSPALAPSPSSRLGDVAVRFRGVGIARPNGPKGPVEVRLLSLRIMPRARFSPPPRSCSNCRCVGRLMLNQPRRRKTVFALS